MDNETTTDYSYQATEDIIYRYLMPLVCIPGILTAAASAYVFMKIRASSLDVLLCGLSLFDVVLLSCSLLMYPSMNLCSNVEHQSVDSMICHFFWKTALVAYPLSNVAQAGSVWTCVGITVDRFVAVSFPIQKRVWCTPNTSFLTLTAVTLFSLAYRLPAFFEGSLEMSALRNDSNYQLFYNMLAYSVLMLLLPWSIIIVLNFIVIVKVREAYGTRCNLAQHSIRRSFKRKDDVERQRLRLQQRIRCTVMAVVMICLFFVCNFPSHINNFIEALASNVKENFRHRIPISNLLVCINSATTILIYCVFNHKFRRAVGGLIGVELSDGERKGVLERAGSYVISGFAVRMMASHWRQRSFNGSVRSTPTRADIGSPLEGATLLDSGRG